MLVETDKRSLLRAFPAPDQRRRQLRRIRGTNAVEIRQILGERSEFLGWKYLVPSAAKLRQQSHCRDAFLTGQVSLPDESSKGAPRLERRSPPHDHALRLATQPAALRGR